jgi:hypothetical protein
MIKDSQQYQWEGTIMLSHRRLVVYGGLISVSMWGSLMGQGLTGQISGKVNDSSGAAVPNAAIELTNEGTGQTRSAVTDPTGAYVFAELLAATYSVQVFSPGFKKYAQHNIVVTVTERVVLRPITLEVGPTSESLSVTAEAAKVQIQSGERTGLLTTSQVLESPVKGRNYLGLVGLLPGVIQTSNIEAPTGGFSVKINGSRDESLTLSLDGIPNMDTGGGTGTQTTPSMESIAELKVMTTSYQAEYGRSYGGIITAVTKSGTKEFHGGAYYFKRNEALNANDFFFNFNGQRRPRYRYDFPGYFLGGPVMIPHLQHSRDKLFFFWSQEFLPRTTPTALATLTVPTALERAGNFSQTVDTNGAVIPIKDPLNTGVQFPGNVIPANRVDPVGQKLQGVFPTPNYTDPNHKYNTVFQGNTSQPHRYEVLRTDWNINSESTFYVQLHHSRDDTSSKDWFNGFPISNTFPLLTGTYKAPAYGGAATLVHTFSPTLVNELTAGVDRFTQTLYVDQSSIARASRSALGVNFPQFYPQNNPLNVLPGATFGGVQNAPSIAWEPRFPFFGTDTIKSVSDNVSKVYGGHNFKAGFYTEWTSRNATAYSGSETFQGIANFGANVNNPLDSNYAFSNAILGNINQYTESSTRPITHDRDGSIEWFVQDNWRVTKRLTLDLGLRFYHIRITTIPGADLSSFEPSLYNPAVAAKLVQPYQPTPTSARVGINPANGQILPAVLIGSLAPGSGQIFQGLAIYRESIMHAPGLMTAPRFGFAYDLFGNGKTALRGGFGMYPGQIAQDRTSDHLTQPPIQDTLNVYYTTIAALTSSAAFFSPTSVLGVQHNLHPPEVYNWSLGVQRDIGFSTVADVAYAGSVSRHLQEQRSINAVPYGTNFLPSSLDPTTGKPLPQAFLRPIIGYQDININEFTGTANYNSMQTSVNRRFKSNLMFGVAWTWSKAMDFSDGNSALSPLISPRIRNYGKAGFDRTHVLVANYDYFLPKFSTRWNNGISRIVFDNWEISGITSFLSGQPLGVSYTTTNNADLTGAFGSGVDSRVILTGNPILSKDQRTFSRSFNTAVVAEPVANFGIGNAPKDVFRGPGINNHDLTLMKNFRLGAEQRRLQFRFEAYNAFNHTQFSAVDNTARFDATGKQVNNTFGQYTGTYPSRRVQLGLKFYY